MICNLEALLGVVQAPDRALSLLLDAVRAQSAGKARGVKKTDNIMFPGIQ